MSIAPTGANAPEEGAQPLFPPRDRTSRAIYDLLRKFQTTGYRRGREVRMTTATTSYARAIVHDYAERLGLLHETDRTPGQKAVVVVRFPESAAPLDTAPEDAPAAKKMRLDRSASVARKSKVPTYTQRINTLAKHATNLTRDEGAPVGAPEADTPATADDASRGAQVASQLEEVVDSALALFAEMRDTGIAVSAHSCSVLVHLCLSASRHEDAVAIFTHCAGLSPPDWAGVPPEAPPACADAPPCPSQPTAPRQETPLFADESSFSGAIRAYCELGRVAEAEHVLRVMGERCVKVRLRSFMPIAAVHCASAPGVAPTPSSHARLERAFELLERMEAADLHPSEEDLLVFATGAARWGHWPRLRAVLERFADRFARLSESTLNGLSDALAQVHSTSAGVAPDFAVCRSKASADGTLDPGGWRLRAVDIRPEQWTELRAAAASIIRHRRDQFDMFRAWLAEREPFDFVVDAANVGYFGNNSTRATVQARSGQTPGEADNVDKLCGRKGAVINFRQITAMIRELNKSGGRTLTCLHEKYIRRCSETNPEDAAYFHQLQMEGALYTTPHGANDDHYWLYAAVASQSPSRCLVVSNDEMRDHAFDMLAPRFFARWKECHIVQYQMYNHYAPDGVIRVVLRHPPAFSSVVQTHGDGRWFFPSSETDEWLCAVAVGATPVAVD
eukprot:CAMPEP_0185181598 /NCGR_PEP_ID=MMETSP1140-20130426/478_1 /TAXON_ID=298111 /ORGANISM="Pavlova sp., Strain CCMP459" /LENGTH=676 /DNA_ID=CAMNT_0027747459 /DNA_START=29 /DNA_END=2059 /DNA_ORIENTATION=+